MIAALDAGKLVSSSNYYGIPYVWRESEGIYHGRLLQYRSVTASETFADSAAAAEWFSEMYDRTYG